jgi:hypothetical protein
VYFAKHRKEHCLEYIEIDICDLSKEHVKMSIHLASYHEKDRKLRRKVLSFSLGMLEEGKVTNS